MARTKDPAAQARISHAVWEVLGEHGPHGLTLRAVAERAGCTTGLVLHRFPDKRALLLHARDLLHERTAARTEALEAAAETPRDALRAVLRQALSLTDETRQEARVWLGYLATALDDEVLAERHRAGHGVFVARTRRLVAEIRPELTEAEVAATATVVVGFIEGVSTLSTADDDHYDAAAQLAALDRLLLVLGLDETSHA
ncbi:TetR/AcrR family transcriptional regulator [Plantibacter sp. CFBP 8798]|uniref:TetR/AcrR family transcriptional regulator n=1 Tax=unclassified Plantibacter TaxID=2624265 RepID=UPI0017800CD3|nr:TetR/AcrR family transcriptional regulator [Plantibacter sp. CFBP 8798]MBD8467724.1 TetR family transcriptional regulator C-terminal domain-containing protein [Plantibacter sp. CFBP 8798]